MPSGQEPFTGSVDELDTILKYCEALQNYDISKANLKIAREELDTTYKLLGIKHRILGWLFPRMYDFRRNDFIE